MPLLFRQLAETREAQFSPATTHVSSIPACTNLISASAPRQIDPASGQASTKELGIHPIAGNNCHHPSKTHKESGEGVCILPFRSQAQRV